MPISNTTKFRGLYTYGNELNVPDGSLVIADNVNIDEPNTVTKRRGFVDYLTSFGTSALDRARHIMSYKNTPIVYFNDELYFSRDDSFYKFDGLYHEVSDDIRFKYAEVNGNFYFTTAESIKKISATSLSQFSTAEGYITNAGVPEALDGDTHIEFSPNGFLPPQSKVAYKILFGKKDANNVLNLGASTSRMVAINSSDDVYTYEKYNLTFKVDEDFKAHRVSVTCPVKADIVQNTVASGISDAYIMVSNADNKNNYQFYFKKDNSAIAPTPVGGATQIMVDITTATTAEQVATVWELTIASSPLTNISVTRSGSSLVFTNTEEGVSNGAVFNNVGINPTTWSKIDNVVGTDSKYIGKYFLLHVEDANICVYYGNARTIGDVPSDSSLVGYTFVPIQIENTSTKSYVSNQTSVVLGQSLSHYFNVMLNSSLTNPVVQLIDKLGGNLDDIEQGTLNSANLETETLTQGNITEGKNAYVRVSFTVPSGIDNTYFFRIYRTSVITADEGLRLDDIDPGEECNLVYEGSVTKPVGEIIDVLDITNETFRASGEYLYNNPITGDGILQNNYAPPVARDITVYRNYTFYGNTKLQHQMMVTTTSIDSLISEVSKILIYKGSDIKEYTFVGKPLEYNIEFPNKEDVLEHTDLTPNAKWYVYSAMDITKYVFYFDKGTSTTPDDTDAIIVKIDLTEIQDNESVAPKIFEAMNRLGDFSVSLVSNTIEVVNTESGQTTEAHTPTDDWSDLGTGITYSLVSQGKGEDTDLGHILLSTSPSVGLKLERTIRSLVKVLNSDVDGFVNAYYLSGQNDLPGKFQIKLRTNEDTPFYLVISDGNGSDFNPEIPSIEGVFTDISKNGDYVELESTFEFENNEEVFISLPNSIPNISGVYNVEVLSPTTIRILAPTYNSGTVDDSTFFFPFEKSDNLYSPNRIYFSKLLQPEAVPLVNHFDVGAKDDPIERIIALRDYMFVLKTDGVYLVSGDFGNWITRMQDTEIILCPDSAVVLNNQIYMVTNSGVVTVNENTPVIISRMIEDQFQEFYNYRDLVRKLGFGVSYRDDRAYIFWLPSSITDTSCTKAFRYNYIEKEWTRWNTGAEASCGLVIGQAKTELYIGSGTRPYVMKERKSLDPYRLRVDYCDRQFTESIGIDAIYQNRLRISSVADVEVNDAVTQVQYLNVQFFNRFLIKLDTDESIPYLSFFSTYECKTGDNLATKLNEVQLKLVEIDTNGTIVYRESNNSDWVEMQQIFNQLMGDLNNPLSMSQFQDYDLSEGTIEYEYVITAVDGISNEITIAGNDHEFIQGNITVYKHITSVIQLNPIHFGNASSFKQVKQGYVLYDQNNFFKMKLEYATDLSPYFEGIEYFGKNPGYWNYGDYGWNNKNYFGGDGSDAPKRTIIPRNKQRCRYISPKITHAIARDNVVMVGVAHDVREFSGRAYR